MNRWFLAPLFAMSTLFADQVSVVDHNELTTYTNRGNQLTDIATKALGSEEIEVWRSHVAVGSSTPIHSHDCEETFIFLSGKGKLIADDQEYFWEAPCTVVIPAGVVHQYFNIGDEPTDGIVILSIGSKIYNTKKDVLILPWRGESLPLVGDPK